MGISIVVAAELKEPTPDQRANITRWIYDLVGINKRAEIKLHMAGRRGGEAWIANQALGVERTPFKIVGHSKTPKGFVRWASDLTAVVEHGPAVDPNSLQGVERLAKCGRHALVVPDSTRPVAGSFVWTVAEHASKAGATTKIVTPAGATKYLPPNSDLSRII